MRHLFPNAINMNKDPFKLHFSATEWRIYEKLFETNVFVFCNAHVFSQHSVKHICCRTDDSNKGEVLETSSDTLVEDISLRDEFSKVYRDDEGKLYAVVYPDQIHYSEDGEFVEVDNTLTLNRTGDGYQSRIERFPVTFSKNSDAEELVSVGDGEYKLSWSVQFVGTPGDNLKNNATASPHVEKVNAQLVEQQDAENVLLGDLRATGSGVATISGIRYNNIFEEKVDLRYTVTHGKVEENIILNAPGAFTGYLLTVNTDGLAAMKTAEGAVQFKTPEGETIFTIAAPWMSDEAGAVSNDITVEVMQKGSVAYQPNATWLSDPSRVFLCSSTHQYRQDI